MAAGERRRELRRRQTRRRKLAYWKRKVENASPADKATIAGKIRQMTPGAEEIIKNWNLEE